MKTFAISQFENEKFTTKMNKYSKRAAKLGIPFGYTLESTSESFYVIRNRQVYNSVKSLSPNDKQIFYTVYHYSVYGESPVINGYTFLAKIESSENGNLIHSHNNDYDFTNYRTCDLTCEHCNINRNRNFYYLVIDESNNVKMLGANCLAQYIAQPNAESIAEFYNDCLGIESNEQNESDIIESFKSGVYDFSIKQFLAYAIIIIRQHGYTSAKNEDYSSGRYSTKSLTLNAWFDSKSEIKVTDEDLIQAESILNHVADELTNKTRLTDYEHNILTMINNKVMKASHAGYIVSIVPLYNRMMENQVNIKLKDTDKTPSQFVGNIGDKLEDLNVKVTKVHSFDTQYGLTFVYTFDYNNNVLVWFTKDLNLNLGDIVTIKKGTVKEHSTYNGVNQTILTRCKI